MIEIEEVAIDLTVPNDCIGMVFMQPFVELCQREPYRWIDDKKDKQIEKIVKTLNIASRKEHGCEKSHFIVFPEYTIPGLEGINEVQRIMEEVSWESGTIVVGGVDGLRKNEYTTLCEQSENVYDGNSPDRVRADQWVNCLVTWIKTIDSTGQPRVHRYVQPKLCPCWQEENVRAHDMFEGKSVYIFKGSFQNSRAFRFMSLICFDWIGNMGTANGICAILNRIGDMPDTRPDGKPMHLIMVLQRNEKPNHIAFLHNAFDYFHGHYPFVIRDGSVVAFVNNAGSCYPGPCDFYGRSSLIFSANSTYLTETESPPSYSVTRSIERQSLRGCKEALFRENGQCIHSFRLFHPAFIERIVENRRRPLLPVLVHGVDDNIRDPRVSGDQVPAVVKWTNDQIDKLQDMTSNHVPLKTYVDGHKNQITGELRWFEEVQLMKMIELATVSISDKQKCNVDLWAENEMGSLETIVYSLTLISCAIPVMVKNAPAHACIVDNNKVVIDIIIVSGGITHIDNIKYVMDKYPGRKERKTLIISRARKEGILTDRDGKIYELTGETRRLGYWEFHACLNSENPDELREKIKSKLGL